MFTKQRLNQAYQVAQTEYFDDKSRYIIFSDAHRGDDSISDEFARNQTLMLSALQYYYYNDYKYIEAGDGDELWEHISFKHVRTAHVDIFTLMKKFYDEDRFILIYGNHNISLKNKGYVALNYYSYYDEYLEKQQELFNHIKPQEAVKLKHRKTNQEILIVHGHQGDAMNDQFWYPTMLALRYFWKFMHLVGFRNPASPAKNQEKRHRIEKNFNKWIEEKKIMLICGHTHRMKFPKKGQLPYFNSGCCIHTKGISGIEILDGEIMLVQWRVLADEEGVLRVVRKVLRGPKPIAAFDMKRGKKLHAE